MKIKIAEIFYSLQGEGRWCGVPSVFLRTFGCNFTCGGFGMPRGQTSTERDWVAVKSADFKRYEHLPLVSTGCDSYASWDARFKDLSPMMEVSGIVDRMHELIPNQRWSDGDVGNDVHLVITGGEPLLGWQRAYPELLEKCLSRGLKNLTFETNGTQPLHEELAEYLEDRIVNFGRKRDNLTFSVSAKLPCSGESWEEAIRPDVVKSYEMLGMTYLKFVVSTVEDIQDVDRAVAEYRAAGFGGPVYVMPVGGVESVYNLNTKHVADLAMQRGYRYSPRLQVDIWRNAWGT
jgi:6-pyruvoyltetrahydropterin 2'-reductase